MRQQHKSNLIDFIKTWGFVIFAAVVSIGILTRYELMNKPQNTSSEEIYNTSNISLANFNYGPGLLANDSFRVVDYNPKIIISCSDTEVDLNYSNYTIVTTLKHLCDEVKPR